MRFLHTADIHLGANPDVGNGTKINRAREIWNSFQNMLEVCEKEQIDLLLIAGDLFHRQPLMRELKDVNYLFGKLTGTQVVLIAGNHDYIKKDSYYRTFRWADNVHMLGKAEMETIKFPKLQTEVSGFSYHTREIRNYPAELMRGEGKEKYSILLLHGGDDTHVPFKKEEILGLGYDYVALGHIHKPQSLVKDKMVYPGAPEPIDKNDIGHHGFVLGELNEEGCRTKFVPFSTREYKHVEVETDARMTGFELKEKIAQTILENGASHIYKIILKGFRDPEVRYDLTGMTECGNIIEIVNQTVPAYNFEQIMGNNEDNILGAFIRELKDCDRESIEYMALCEGVKALMETRRD